MAKSTKWIFARVLLLYLTTWTRRERCARIRGNKNIPSSAGWPLQTNTMQRIKLRVAFHFLSQAGKGIWKIKSMTARYRNGCTSLKWNADPFPDRQGKAGLPKKQALNAQARAHAKFSTTKRRSTNAEKLPTIAISTDLAQRWALSIDRSCPKMDGWS